MLHCGFHSFWRSSTDDPGRKQVVWCGDQLWQLGFWTWSSGRGRLEEHLGLVRMWIEGGWSPVGLCLSVPGSWQKTQPSSLASRACAVFHCTVLSCVWNVTVEQNKMLKFITNYAIQWHFKEHSLLAFFINKSRWSSRWDIFPLALLSLFSLDTSGNGSRRAFSVWWQALLYSSGIFQGRHSAKCSGSSQSQGINDQLVPI